MLTLLAGSADVPLPNGVMFPSDEDTELGEAVDDGWLDLGLASLR